MLGLGLQALASIERDLDREGAVRAIHFSPDHQDLLAGCHNVARVWRLASPPGDTERLVDRGFVPSVRLLDLVGFLEDEFHIRLRAVDVIPEKLATISQIAAVVRARLTQAPKR